MERSRGALTMWQSDPVKRIADLRRCIDVLEREIRKIEAEAGITHIMQPHKITDLKMRPVYLGAVKRKALNLGPMAARKRNTEKREAEQSPRRKRYLAEVGRVEPGTAACQ